MCHLVSLSFIYIMGRLLWLQSISEIYRCDSSDLIKLVLKHLSCSLKKKIYIIIKVYGVNAVGPQWAWARVRCGALPRQTLGWMDGG